MDDTAVPRSETELADILQDAVARRMPFDVQGNGGKRGFGLAGDTTRSLSTRALTGIVDYQPAELVMTARAGTPLAEIGAALEEHGQCLPFEPPILEKLYGREDAAPTIGGIFLGNLSGPRRHAAGAARDYLLGVRGVNGRGECWKAGGRVIKNVTGYDTSRLMAGSWGTLSVISELSFKVLPAPESEVTLALPDLSPDRAMEILRRLAGDPLQPGGLAFLPVRARKRARLLPDSDGSLCLVRLEGAREALREKIAHLARRLSKDGPVIQLDREASAGAWIAVRDLHAVAGMPAVIRLSVPPALAPSLVPELESDSACTWFADCAGAWLWVGMAASAAEVSLPGWRRTLDGGASAVLFHGPEALKRSTGVFSPVSPAAAALAARVKAAFDPLGLLNPGRLVNR